MTELARALCSIAPTRRRRFVWAAWWTGEPCESPFRPPDAADGGARTAEAALAAAQARAGRALELTEPYWAHAWSAVLRGEPVPRRPRARGDRPARRPPRPAHVILGVPADAPPAAIKAAFRARALVLHPDHGGDPDAFRELRAAYARALRRSRH